MEILNNLSNLICNFINSSISYFNSISKVVDFFYFINEKVFLLMQQKKKFLFSSYLWDNMHLKLKLANEFILVLNFSIHSYYYNNKILKYTNK